MPPLHSQHPGGQVLVTLLEFTHRTMEIHNGSITFSVTQLANGVWVGTFNSLVLNPQLLTITYPALGNL